MRLLILDNRDSFTFNLAESFRKIGVEDVKIFNSESYSIEQLADYDRIVLGPGPGLPQDHPILFNLLNSLKPHQSVLGICLGHEALAIHYGGQIRHLNRVFHGDEGKVLWKNAPDYLSKNVPDGFAVGLYHSWIIDEASLPEDIVVTALSENGLIMGIKHANLPLFGFQFHPESFITKFGLQLLSNWYYQSM
ncbi:MAG: aminodeoxychorismate/anthranilate synthase component II [Bacteroidales bacterium]|nr:aminodeoxychorismate/anthranilate synthase component II [Bacteroidales bacterium]